ncbi:MAG: hypothetical protein ABJK65_09350, partial [Kangiellaceae bacterium]
LAEEAHNESRFRYIQFSAKKVEKIALAAIKNDKRHAVMIAEKDAQPVGFAYCSVGEYHIGTGALITTIHNINVSKDVRSSLSGGRTALGLFRGIETWSKARDAKEILFHITSDVDLARAHKLAKRLKYAFIGGSYAKSI